MSEEIIIDGVNVAECEYYIQDYQRANNIEGRYEHCKDVCELNGDNYFYCKMNKNCHYKQLKRLQAENERLKERQINWYNDEAQKYKQALEEIQNFLDVPEFYIYSKEVIHNRIENKISEVLK